MVVVRAEQPQTAERRRDSVLLRAFRGEPTERVPVWFMRQAGRSLPEYRAIREHAGLFEICRSPALAAEVTVQPVRRLGVDAAIIFSDITVPLAAIGIDVTIDPGIGPVIGEPVRTRADLRRLRRFEPEVDAPYMAEAVRLAVAELDVPLIGFAGGPFTLATYLIEGGPSKTHTRTRALMYDDSPLWRELLELLAEVAIATLRAQVAAGAQAVQLFESWAGVLSPESYRTYVLPAARRIFEGTADLGVPRIHFGVGSGELLSLFATAGADVVGVDWRVPLDVARTRLGASVAVQGNLDPAVCLAPWPVAAEQVLDVLRRGGGRGHVFNLGHGVLPATSPDTLKRIVELVGEQGVPGGGGLEPAPHPANG
ncbi:MAG: uroporphyrinogen decarboxylase [Solirubrobacteraceae bacterium]